MNLGDVHEAVLAESMAHVDASVPDDLPVHPSQENVDEGELDRVPEWRVEERAKRSAMAQAKATSHQRSQDRLRRHEQAQAEQRKQAEAMVAQLEAGPELYTMEQRPDEPSSSRASARSSRASARSSDQYLEDDDDDDDDVNDDNAGAAGVAEEDSVHDTIESLEFLQDQLANSEISGAHFLAQRDDLLRRGMRQLERSYSDGELSFHELESTKNILTKAASYDHLKVSRHPQVPPAAVSGALADRVIEMHDLVMADVPPQRPNVTSPILQALTVHNT